MDFNVLTSRSSKVVIECDQCKETYTFIFEGNPVLSAMAGHSNLNDRNDWMRAHVRYIHSCDEK